MTQPRSHYVDQNHARYYHIGSRCVRRAWLLGYDPLTRTNYDHRKDIFLDHLKHVSRFFPIEVMGCTIMSNHFHLVVRYDPNAASRWTEEEVARRWCALFNGLPLTQRLQGPTTVAEFSLQQALRFHELLTDPSAIARCRTALSSLSRFMQHLKQPFAVWANHEDECTGHFFESRFYSGVLLTESDLLSCMAYVDLNPVEAGMAHALRACTHTSVHERLYAERFDAEVLENYLAPLWEGKEQRDSLHEAEVEAYAPSPACTLKTYVEQLNLAIIYKQHPDQRILDRVESWMARLLNRDRDKPRSVPAFFDYV